VIQQDRTTPEADEDQIISKFFRILPSGIRTRLWYEHLRVLFQRKEVMVCSLPRRMMVVFSALIVCASNSPAQSSKADLPNDMSIELLGRCLIYSFSYQRMVTPNVGIEVGASVLGGSDESVGFLAAGCRFYALTGDGSPCISGGIVAVTASTGSGPFSSDNSASYGYVAPGFEYRSSGGFVARGSVYVLIRSESFFVWPGVEVGIAF
jgi:hypothetical protein